MNVIKIIKKSALVAAVVLLLLPNLAQSQLVNNGGSITVNRNAILYADQYITNASGGVIVNNGATIAHTDINNNPGATLSGSGTYSIQGNFTNLGTYHPDLSVLNFFGTGNSYLQNSSGIIYAIQMSKVPNSFVDILDSETVTGDISFGSDSNWIRLNNNNLTLDTSCSLYNYNETKYVITNGSGFLKKKKINNTPFVFPVGFDPSHYNPLTIAEKGIADDYSVQCLEHALLKGTSGNPVSSGGIDAGWSVKEAVQGGANATINATWSTPDELPAFDYTHCMLARYNGTKWDYQANKAGAASGTIYRTISRSGLANLGSFTVLSLQNPSFTGNSSASEKEVPAVVKIKSSSIKIYPTLVQNYFTVAVQNNDYKTYKMSISLVDEGGKTVWQKQNAAFQTQKIDLPYLVSGFYTVLIRYGTDQCIQKILIGR